MLHDNHSRTIYRTNEIKVNAIGPWLALYLTLRSAERQRVVLLHLIPTQLVQCGLKIVENNGISEAFEDEGEFPEGIDVSNVDDRDDGEKIDDDKDDAEKHTQQQEAESWGYTDDLKGFEVIAVFDVPE
ncbi:hypothetical protein ACHAPA_008340 [Fusarium lateritium]